MTEPRILIVEDDHDLRELVKEFLELEGFAVDVCASGREALNFLATGRRPALIMLDFRMPGMSGPQFLEHCQEMFEGGPPAPVYLFSAEQSIGDFKNLGVRGIIPKPIDFDALTALLREYL